MEGMFEGPGQPWLSTAGFPAAAREGGGSLRGSPVVLRVS